MINYLPKYISNRAITIYVAALFVVTMLYMNMAMSWYWFAFGLVEVVGFFYFANRFSRKWLPYSEKLFIKKIFITALIIRVIYVVFSYWFCVFMYDNPLGANPADAGFYDGMARAGHNLLSRQGFFTLEEFKQYTGADRMAISDSGYPVYLSFIYFLTDDSIFLSRIIKALFSAFMCVLIYHLAKRNFNENVGRIAAIFCMLMPNLIYYCGLQLKECEMVFVVVAFMERADHAMRSSKFTFGNMILPVLLAGCLFFFRTVLGVTALFAFFTAIFLTSGRVIKMGKRIVLGIWILVAAGYFVGGRIATEVEEVWQNRENNQSNSMQWRAERKGGNEFAKYAGVAVFAPLIFTIPFPTMVETPGQENQRMIHGGNFVKNITSFFTISAIFLLFFKWKTWKNHILILAFTGGYLAVIAMSAFAQSERFHLPVLPFALILAAFGVSQMTDEKYKIYLNWWTIFIFIACVAWAWFKLAGRGMTE
ncbi:hypothetical protein FACS18945_3520 [Bacteroidia bacterium]|nr:hypothetical protein FACS18945_3520 [Bacteroidia bacterium]